MNTQTWQLPKNYVIDPDTGDMTIFNHDGSITVLRKDPATGAYSLEHNGVKVSQDQFNLSMLWALMKETAKAPGMEGPDIQDVIPLVLAAASGDSAKHMFLDDMAKALKAQSEAVLAGVSRQAAHAQFLSDVSAVVQKNSAGMAQHLDASARATLNKALAGLTKAGALEIRAARSSRAADLIDARYGKISAVLDVVSLLSALAEGDSNEILKTSLGILAGIFAGTAAVFFGAPMLLGIGIGLLGSWGTGVLYDAFIGPNIGDLGNFWDNLFGALGLGDGVGGDFAAARNLVPRRDPLALDLDGDGIETVGVRAGVLFDHDGDGVRQGTGWIGPDDGLLVLDRNGNGRIDNGTELFGVDTPLPDGSQPRSGFAALSSLDSNGDGIFDARDARFADVRVWRDLNQDGISQATELFTLEGLGIASIGLTPHSADDQNLGNGNIIDNHGTYVRTDGSSGAIVDMQFAVENFYREFDRGTHPVTLLDAVKALPDLRGSGAVRDLREAASLSPALLQALQAVVPGMSRDALLARIDGIVTLWAASSGMKTGEEIVEGEAGGRTLRYHGVVPQSVQAQGESAVSAWKTAQHATLGPIIALLERFNGSTLVSISGDRVSTGGRGFGGGTMQTEIDVELWPEQIAPLLRAHAALVDSVYGALALGVRLKDVMASFRPVFGSQGLSWDTAGMTAALWAKWQGDTLGALQDVMDIKRYASAQMEMADWPGLSVLTEMVRQTRALAGGDQVLARAGISLVQGSASGGSGQDWLWGGTAADTINGGAGADFLVGGEGDDRLNGNGGDDEIAGGVGNDRLVGGDGSDVLLGEQGDDNLEGEGGNDLLIGGAGNDKLRGGFGNDTYHFDLGWGSDRLYNDDTSRGRTDIIRFGAGILAGDIRVSRSYSDLLLTHANGDRITVDMGLYYDALAGTAFRIDEVHFDDGTIWTMEQIKQMLLQPTSGADSITGYATDDTLRGGEGNDKIFGEGGNDTLYGDAGNDDLDGGAGNDVLIGGGGNDILRGGAGSDTYHFDLGWGSDKIVANDTGTGRVETIRFGEGILASDIRLSRTTYDLVLTHSNGDRITVDMGMYYDAVAGSYYRIDQVSFADGTLWSMDQIKQMLLQPTNGADNITGYATDDTLRGGEGNDKILGEGGNDTLYGDAGNDDLDGGAGNDVLIGGGGNDILRGGAGSDTYHFDLGWGSDKIVANDTGTGRVETIRFGEGILASDIRLSRTTNDLVLTHSNGDRITVDMGMYYDAVAGSYYRIDQVSFADGTLWSMDQIKQMLLQPTSGADSITGYATDDTLRGGEGNDKILGEGGNDTLYGDAGNDDLDGGAGNDVLIGGSGNDTLRGGNGSDTYRFDLGWGSDKIVANDTGTGRVETIQFGEGILASDIRLSRTTYDLVLTHSNGDRITVDMGLYNDALAGSYYRIDQVSFADGTLWTMDQIKLMLLQPTPGADRQLGYASNDVLDGGEGNDELDGAGGNDVLIGGGGNDTLRGGAGSDTYHFDPGWGSDRIIVSDSGAGRVETVRFGAGITASDIRLGRAGSDLLLTHVNGDRITVDMGLYNDAVAGSAYRIDQVSFADGTLWTMDQIKLMLLQPTPGADRLLGYASNDLLDGGEGNDELDGAGGNDVLIGGGGNDILRGGAGSDTYHFELGWGSDRIIVSDTGAGRVETVRFGAGITASDIRLGRAGSDLLLTHVNGDRITVDMGLYNDAAAGSPYRIDQVSFADGTLWTMDQIKLMLLQPTPGADRLLGYASNDLLDGGEGNDELDGAGGNDVLIGGGGNDILRGGAGSDTYHFDLGWGSDRIIVSDTGAGRVETVRFGAGITASDIRLGRAGSDLLLTHVNGDRITVDMGLYNDAAAGGPYRIDQVSFADGTLWTMDQIKLMLLQPTPGADRLLGYASNDLLDGGEGNDELDGAGGNDVLIGGGGNDILRGGAGSDTYHFDLGWGSDRIIVSDSGAGRVETVRFGAGITASDIRLGRAGSDLLLTHVNGDRITVDMGLYNDAAAGSPYRIDQVSFADGTLWTMDQIKQMLLRPTSGAASTTGVASNGLIQSDEGNDRLHALAGHDTLYGDAIYSADRTAGRFDVIEFGEGIGAVSPGSYRSDHSNEVALLISALADGGGATDFAAAIPVRADDPRHPLVAMPSALMLG